MEGVCGGCRVRGGWGQGVLGLSAVLYTDI